MKILLLEDDEILSEIIEEYLISQDFSVDLALDGEEAEQLSFQNSYDLFIFDVNVPKIDGFTLLKNIRASKISVPTIFITSLNTVKDLERGFEVGADDYIKKPFELDELRIRINNIKRVHKIGNKETIEVFTNIFFEPLSQNLNGEKISKKESQVLEFLLKRRGELVSTEELLTNIWSYDEAPSSMTIRTYIKNIRKILGNGSIETVKGIGYRFK